MARYRTRWVKTDGKGAPVSVCEDAWHAWFVSRPGDAATHPTPMGAFATAAAARDWADRRFPGGEWEPARRAASPLRVATEAAR